MRVAVALLAMVAIAAVEVAAGKLRKAIKMNTYQFFSHCKLRRGELVTYDI